MDAARPLSLDRFAGISARIEVGLPRERVLAEEQVSTETWELTQVTWLARLGAHAAQRKLGLQRRYGELLAAHRKAALLQLREERRKLSGPMPVAPVTRVALLALPSLGTAEEVPSPAPIAIPLMTAQLGGATTDISAVVQNLLAGKAATPFGGTTTPPPPTTTAHPGSETTDISAVVQRLLAGQVTTPFARGATPATASIMTTTATAPPRALPSTTPRETQVGSATEDISSVVQRVLASKSATPFAQTTPAPAGAAPTGALGPSATVPDLPPHLPNLTLEHYAELRLQLWRDPARTAEILGLWRIPDAHSWAQLQAHWQRRLADDAALAQRWTQVVAELKAARGFK